MYECVCKYAHFPLVSIPHQKLFAKPPALGPLASVLVADESLNCATNAQQVALLPMLRALREFLLAEANALSARIFKHKLF